MIETKLTDAPLAEVQKGTFDQFQRGVQIDVYLADVLTLLNTQETTVHPTARAALIDLRALARRSIFWGLTDIRHFGTPDQQLHAQDMMEDLQTFYKTRLATADLVAPKPLRSEISRYLMSQDKQPEPQPRLGRGPRFFE